MCLFTIIRIILQDNKIKIMERYRNRMKDKLQIKLTTTQIIMLSFVLGILIGSILLSLPISSATGKPIAYIDALFTATTSVCVTGLVTVPTVSTWSTFGHIVILILIQIGGLGIITVISGFLIILNQRIGIGERILIQDAFNLNTMSGMVKFIKKVLIGTVLVEGIGAFFYLFVFIPEFGISRGIWISVFNSVSAFCNAGIDIIAEDSLCRYVSNPLINIVTGFLIIVGGIGYIVWWDFIQVLKNFRIHKWRCFTRLSLHSKIAVSITSLLIIVGTVCILIFEYNNPLTIGNFTLVDKIQASFFQSITTRTAGFLTIPQENFTNSSALISLILMFIGGSPVGTAGGIKTVTIAVLFLSAWATIKNKDEVDIYNRRIGEEAIRKSVAVAAASFAIMFLSTIFLSAVTKADFLDILYETVSATATVGLTRSLTSTLNVLGKIIIILTMYLGRVGPISLLLAFNTKRGNKNIVKNPKEDISVG